MTHGGGKYVGGEGETGRGCSMGHGATFMNGFDFVTAQDGERRAAAAEAPPSSPGGTIAGAQAESPAKNHPKKTAVFVVRKACLYSENPRESRPPHSCEDVCEFLCAPLHDKPICFIGDRFIGVVSPARAVASQQRASLFGEARRAQALLDLPFDEGKLPDEAVRLYATRLRNLVHALETVRKLVNFQELLVKQWSAWELDARLLVLQLGIDLCVERRQEQYTVGSTLSAMYV